MRRDVDQQVKGARERQAQAALLVVLPVVTALTLWLGVRPWMGLVGEQRTRAVEAYRYRFERTPRGAVRQMLESEIAFYQTRLGRDPRSGLDLAALSGAYLKMARATGDLTWVLLAEQTASRSLASLPFQNSGALLVLAKVAEARHDFDQAIRLAKQSGSSDALAIITTSNLGIGRIDEAAKAVERLVRTQPGLGSLTLRGLVEISQGHDDAAVADLNRAIASEEPGEAGSSAWARTLLGRLHYRRGRLGEARRLYVEALRILPQYPLALLHLAEIETRWGHYSSAEDYLTHVVNITRASPNIYDHAVWRGLARIKELQGDRHGALRFWDEAEARLRADTASGHFGHQRELARLLLERGRREDLREALHLTQAELRVRRDSETLFVLAWALSEHGRWLEARRAIQEGMRWGVRDARLFYRAALIEEALGNPTGALKFRAAALQVDPTFDEHARRLAGLGF